MVEAHSSSVLLSRHDIVLGVFRGSKKEVCTSLLAKQKVKNFFHNFNELVTC